MKRFPSHIGMLRGMFKDRFGIDPQQPINTIGSSGLGDDCMHGGAISPADWNCETRFPSRIGALSSLDATIPE